ncbi:thiol reductant ABC exporter subunit CydC [Pseudochrobactrum sp. HB0163]|uniref:thiol reductant ABC exporter subunit CydC n=1 Tax=Pseudochrobactrum sp. HB0163 TaxID=3450708 RepID=UPI003F6DF537
MNRLAVLKPVLKLFFTEKRTMLWAGMVLAAITVLCGILLLGLSGWFLTATAIAGLSAATALAFDVFAPAAGIRLLAILRTASRYCERLVTHDATLAVLAALREKLFRSWAAPQAARQLLRRPSRLLFRLTADIDALDALYLRVLVPASAAFFVLLVAGLAFYLIDPAFALAGILVLLIAGFGLPVVAALRAFKPMRKRAKAIEAVRARSVDLVSGQTDLVMAGRLDAQCAAIARADQYLSQADDKLNRIEILVGAGFGIASVLLLCLALFCGVVLAQAGVISPAVAAFALLLALGAMEPFAGLRRGAMELGRILMAAQRIGDRYQTQPQFYVPLQPADPYEAVHLHQVTMRYEDHQRPVLSDISLQVKKGEKLAIIGTSGAGKSTLMALLAGEVEATTGIIRHEAATLLTQKTQLFQDSVAENLRLAQPEASDGDLWQALEMAGLRETVEAMPQRLQTMLGEGGLGLSGGQARRLALARLFLHNTPLWLLDEPTEGLDKATAQDILQRLAQSIASQPDKTLIIATHLRREAEIADRIVVLRNGHISHQVQRDSAEFLRILQMLRQV